MYRNLILEMFKDRALAKLIKITIITFKNILFLPMLTFYAMKNANHKIINKNKNKNNIEMSIIL